MTAADGVELIAAERDAQVTREGYLRRHDDSHDKGEMATAALCYLRVVLTHVDPDSPNAAAPINSTADWPWPDGYKPDWGDPIPNLVKAGALIAAEIDRLQRSRRDA